MQTHFDVIPIGSDGRFSTPPLPANSYQFEVNARLATTPEQERLSPDFNGWKKVVVPETGEIPPVEIVVKGNVPAGADRVKVQNPKEPRLEVRAFDRLGRRSRTLRSSFTVRPAHPYWRSASTASRW